MELNSAAIRDAIHPTAATTPLGTFAESSPSSGTRAAVYLQSSPWDESQLNPKNRIDSLDPPLDPLWRMDGCTGLGTQFYATPLFLDDAPPMRFDVFIPEEVQAASPRLRELLDLSVAFHTKDAVRLGRLGISRHIVRTLQAWITKNGRHMYSDMCKTLPFGSRIIFENLEANIHAIRLSIVPTYYVERQLLPLAGLNHTLGLTQPLPEAIDISTLSVVQQLADSACLVRMSSGRADDENGKLWVLKAMTSDTKYLFVELRNLLQMEPHPNIISRPEYLVTKQCRFGGKTAVVGYLLSYHKPGSLRDKLPLLRINGRLTLRRQLKWAAQLTSAVRHVWEQGGMFYPDLRLDNILLSSSDDIVMVDFEQRGVWCEFASPEVNAIEYVRILASDESDDDAGRGPSHILSELLLDGFVPFLEQLLPGWHALQACESYASSRPQAYANYNIAWLSLDKTEQEASMVYMLGRVLWCIFEGQSAPQTAVVWQSYRCEPDIEFPAYRLTPPGLRNLIDCCTRGRREALSSLVVRRKSKLVLRDQESSSPEEVREFARTWWQAEVHAMVEYIRMRRDQTKSGSWDGNHSGRPKLKEALTELEQFCLEMDAANTTGQL
jgi:serine/threonine protein kinase